MDNRRELRMNNTLDDLGVGVVDKKRRRDENRNMRKRIRRVLVARQLAG